MEAAHASRWEHAVAIGLWYQSQITAPHVVTPALLLQPVLFFADPPRGPVSKPFDRWTRAAARERRLASSVA